ncbi:MAG: universal stress protein [Burkholderiales bacterium]
MYRNILLPTDGTPLSVAAVRSGVKLASSLGARVTGLFVAPVPTPLVYRKLLPVGIDTLPHNKAAIRAAAERHLDVIVRAARAAGVPCETASLTSDFPAEAILDAARKYKCDLIYMASHSRKGMKAMLLGSQTQKVLAHAGLPVLVYR